jgi:hypothetical protein
MITISAIVDGGVASNDLSCLSQSNRTLARMGAEVPSRQVSPAAHREVHGSEFLPGGRIERRRHVRIVLNFFLIREMDSY